MPRAPLVEADPPALDNVHAMEEAGVDVGDPALEAPQHAALRRAALSGGGARGAAHNGAAFLCAHVAFRAMAGGTPFAEALCGGDAVGYP